MTSDPPSALAPADAASAAGPPTAGPSTGSAGVTRDARRIRGYVLRGGRLGPGQERALAEQGPRFVVPWSAAAPDWDALFGRAAPRLLEIGFGMGDATAAVAAAMPGHDLIGVEVHEAGVGALLKLVGERGLGNVRIVRHDAVEVLRTMIAPDSLAGIHVWFPDPWPKKRHHKRRLLQPPFVAALAARLAPGGYLHCATDWQPYAEQMREVLAAEPLLRDSGRSGRPPWRPLTRFEQRGLNLGHGVWDWVFLRR
mgnify:CR=1 FL=1